MIASAHDTSVRLTPIDTQSDRVHPPVGQVEPRKEGREDGELDSHMAAYFSGSSARNRPAFTYGVKIEGRMAAAFRYGYSAFGSIAANKRGQETVEGRGKR